MFARAHAVPTVRLLDVARGLWRFLGLTTGKNVYFGGWVVYVEYHDCDHIHATGFFRTRKGAQAEAKRLESTGLVKSARVKRL